MTGYVETATLKTMEVRFLGTTDDVTTCECCGRANLKSTVAISIDGSDAMYYGVTCAAHALSRDAKYIRSEAKKADQERAKKEAAERDARWRAETARWFDFLARRGIGGDVFTRIQSLGGHTAAKALYAEETLRQRWAEVFPELADE